MSNIPPDNFPASVYDNGQEANSIDALLTNVNILSNQLHSLMAMLSGFRKHLSNSQENTKNLFFSLPPHVNLEIVQVLQKYNANRLSDVMFKIQKEINKLLIDAKALNKNDALCEYDLLSVLKNLEESFSKAYHIQKMMEDVEENNLRQIEAIHE